MLVNRWTLTLEHNVQSELRGSPFYYGTYPYYVSSYYSRGSSVELNVFMSIDVSLATIVVAKDG